MKYETGSPNEKQLFHHFGLEHTIGQICPSIILLMCTKVAFMRNTNNLYTDALRRAWQHLEDGKYRGNEEYEKLIEIRNDPK